jgi:hypothetical protein
LAQEKKKRHLRSNLSISFAFSSKTTSQIKFIHKFKFCLQLSLSRFIINNNLCAALAVWINDEQTFSNKRTQI